MDKDKTEAVQPQRHLAGLYLANVLNQMIVDVGRSDDPLRTFVETVDALPLEQRRDLLCCFIRELRSQVKRTAAREIADRA